MTEHVDLRQDGRVLTVTLNRPDKKNALTHAMYEAMGQAILSAQDDPDIRVLVFTGAGDAFTAGNDLTDFRDEPPIGRDTPVGRFLALIASTPVPVVAAVNGMAVGVGLTMLLHCDLVYAARSATFQVPFVDLALVPEAASSLLLPARVGRAKAAELFMMGERWSAQEAYDNGLVGRLFDDADLAAEVAKRSAQLAAKAPTAVRQTKQLMRPEPEVMRERMGVEGKIFGAQLQSDELREAIAAFYEKRAPHFG